jgi:hypothetical protein
MKTWEDKRVEEIESRTENVTLPASELTTIYTIKPGGLYWVRLPDAWEQDQIDLWSKRFRTVFTPQTQRLNPPAHFLVSHGGVIIERCTDEEIQAMIDRYQALLEQRSSEKSEAAR